MPVFFTALTAFLIKISNIKLDQMISILLTLRKYFTGSHILFCICGTFLNIPRGICIIIDNNYKLLIIFQQVDVYLIEPIKIDVLIKLAHQ